MSLGCEGIQVPRPRCWDKSQVQDMPRGQRKRQICILAPGKSVPTEASSPYGQQQFRPVAPGCASTQSRILAPLLVVPRALCHAPRLPPDPSAGTELLWPRVVACWATGQAQAGDSSEALIAGLTCEPSRAASRACLTYIIEVLWKLSPLS